MKIKAIILIFAAILVFQAAGFSESRDERIYKLGKKYAAKGAYDKAIDYLWKLINEYPKSEYADSALYYLGNYCEKSGNSDFALSAYGRLINSYPESYYVDGAIFRAGRIYLLRGEIEMAYSIYGLSKIAKTGTETPQALFWWGKTAEKLGRYEDAAGIYYYLANRYDHNFYTYRARDRLTDLGYIVPDKKAHPGSLETAEAFTAGLDAADILIKRSALGGENENITKKLLCASYPRGYWGKVESESKKNGIDPYLTLAVIREESKFKPNALSRSKAHGLMQIMPSTGKILARAQKLDGYNRKKLYEADTNIELGTYFLSDLLKTFDNNLPIAVAAYNGGPTRVGNWVDAWYNGNTDNIDVDEFIIRIPIYETRRYVQKVLGSYYEYKRLYCEKY